jgi:signal transduction histidine kinase
MKNSNGNNNHYFGIHASLVFQLGESLISDSVQALVELVKNAYDADADYAKVTVETSKKNDIENSRYRNARGYILVEDNGSGMSMDDIEKGWLTISNSIKREMKEHEKKTEKGRTPLGDKGLGRLGAQRLGYNLEIFTKPDNAEYEYRVAFSWKDFENKNRLDEVKIDIKEFPSNRKKGTLLLISDIKEPNSFKGEDGCRKLQDELSRMISPYEGIEGFYIKVKVDGKDIDLADFKKEILNGSEVRYKIDFDEKILSIKGKARLRFISPQKRKEKPLFRQLVESDEGDAFYNFLSEQSKAKSSKLKKSQEEGWFVEYEQTHPIKNIDGLESIEKENGKQQVANPGKFQGRVDSFDLSKEGAAQQSVFDKLSGYRQHIKDLSGIKVYRDGFGIRVDRDWLRLGKQWTSGRSYYGLKLDNTLGYIALSAEDNKNLEETTDREGFKETPYYNNFYKMLQIFVDFTGAVQEFLRRGWIDFLEKHHKEAAGVKDGITTEEISEKIGKSLSKAVSYHTYTGDLKVLLTQETAEAKETINFIKEHLHEKVGDLDQLKTWVESLRKQLKEASAVVVRIDEYLKEVSELGPLEKVLENQIKNLREQLEQIYELASLGLTAESLSHEIHTIADRLAKYTGELRSYLKGQKRKDPKILSFVEHVDTSISALRKQLSHLAPSLKYVREKKEKIDIYRFCREIAFFHRDSLKNNNIEVQVIPKKADNFYIFMNRGKLTQIFDNLFYNSDYWLREDIRTKNLQHGKIIISVDKPFITFYDNGRGVDPSVELTLFEPFVTTKGRGRGRGLGLFLVRQFLDPEGCTISLLPDRNKHDRLFIFELDLTGGLNEE